METDKIDARSSGSGKVPGKSRARTGSAQFGMTPVPLEWMDGSSWRLPSGKALAEFALQAGFLAPLMLRMPRLSRMTVGSAAKPAKKGKSS